VWTTFSADQVDLNYGNPAVMVRVLGVLLDYARRGAAAIRLDAIGFLWKELGTSCLHLSETHAMIQLFRACLDDTYPVVQIITDQRPSRPERVVLRRRRVPEAQAVYQFPLPPLVLHSFATGDASLLTQWAATIGPEFSPGVEVPEAHFVIAENQSLEKRCCGVETRTPETSAGSRRRADALEVPLRGFVSDGATSPFTAAATVLLPALDRASRAAG
jgi:hypothetical protein